MTVVLVCTIVQREGMIINMTVSPVRKGLTRRARNNLNGYLFLLPSLLGFLFIIVIPVIASLFLSFTEWDMVSGIDGIKFIGFQNYIEMWTDDWFTSSFKNNLLYSVMMVPLTLGLGLLIAVLLNEKVYCRGPLRAMYFVPYISNAVAVSIVWMALLHPSRGPINAFLSTIGIANPPRWLASSQWALISVTVINVWINAGYCMVIYLAALQGIPKELYEAAEIDRATGFKKFRYITLPLLSPTTFFLLINLIITSFKVFATINVITQGGPGNATMVLVYYLYLSAFRYYRMGYASALAWVLFILIFIVTLIQWRGQKKWVNM